MRCPKFGKFGGGGVATELPSRIHLLLRFSGHMRSGVAMKEDTTSQDALNLGFKVDYGGLVMFHIYRGATWQECDERLRQASLAAVRFFSLEIRIVMVAKIITVRNKKRVAFLLKPLQMLLPHWQMLSLLLRYRIPRD